jgi:hypothetical protein
MAEDGDSELAEKTQEPKTRDWSYLLVLSFPIYGIIQGATLWLDGKNVMSVPPVTYDIYLAAFCLLGLPATAYAGWRYLRAEHALRGHWVTRPLAIASLILIIGMIAFSFMRWLDPEMLKTRFSDTLLIVTMSALAVFVSCGVVVVIRVLSNASPNG